MNKLLLTLTMFLAAMTAGAQESETVDRMVVHQKDGSTKTYVIGNVDSLTFKKSEFSGEVSVSVNAAVISSEGSEKITKAFGMATLPDGCKYGDVALIPDNGTVTDISEYIKCHSQQRINTNSYQWTFSRFEANAKYLVGVQGYTDNGEVVGYATAELSTGDGSVNDLGEGANTYIVPAKGKYSFMPMHVDGGRITGISKVDWIWSTKAGLGNGQNLVSDLALDAETGRISFSATGKKGSVVIAAFDENEKVMWTWLLWCTEQPEVMEYENGVKFMDRFIGATSANPDDGTATWGLVWQWGRPTPFFAGYEENEWAEADAMKEAKTWTVVNSNYDFAWEVKDERMTMEQAIAAPMTFLKAPDSPCEWASTIDLSRWTTSKTNYDPCPAGYRLPSLEEIFVLSRMSVSAKNQGYTYSYNGNTAWWPSSGSGREYDTGCNIIGTMGVYMWTATALYVNDFYLGMDNLPSPYRLVSNNGNIFTKSLGNSAFAHSIRCVVDTRRR